MDSKLRETIDHLVKCDLVSLPEENTDPELSGAYHLLLRNRSRCNGSSNKVRKHRTRNRFTQSAETHGLGQFF